MPRRGNSRQASAPQCPGPGHRPAGPAITRERSRISIDGKSSAEQERLIDEELASLRTWRTRVSSRSTGSARWSEPRPTCRAGAAVMPQMPQKPVRAAGATQFRRLEGERAFRERASGDLRQVEATLSELLPKYRAPLERARPAANPAPARGWWSGLKSSRSGAS